MRHAGVAPLVVFLLVILLVVGAAAAAGGKGKGGRGAMEKTSATVDEVSQWLVDQADATRAAGDDVAHQVSGEAQTRGTGGGLFAALIVGGSALLLAAMGTAKRSRQLRWRPANAFEAGRVRAYAAFATTSDQAVEGASRLRGVGGVTTWRMEGETVHVEMDEKRRASCEEIAGYLSGAFETVWGHDVHVKHEICGRKKRGTLCAYEVRTAPPTVGR